MTTSEHEACRLIPAQAGKTVVLGVGAGALAAHPRAGGENQLRRLGVDRCLGSSPRRRGKPNWRRRRPVGSGLIPAQAGKTCPLARVPQRGEAHPRAGRENQHKQPLPGGRRGSSPRRRGKRYIEATGITVPGLIPAQAGKTSWSGSSWAVMWAHPRAGGENDQGAPDHGWPVGSSPRRRGKLGGKKGDVPKPGLIPAQAGKTCSTSSRRPPQRAHPRAGGENATPAKDSVFLNGSSPRRRGKLRHCRGRARRRRLIPAQAGKTHGRRPPPVTSSAHPRVDGENAACSAATLPAVGSSPRGRGKPRGRRRGCAGPRLIPAWTGKTMGGRSTRCDIGAHPRMGGENCVRAGLGTGVAGSSPHGRGKRVHRTLPAHAIGLIPAWAGKTPQSLPGYETRRGSSPHGRGKRTSGSCQVSGRRLIPARAGKTVLELDDGRLVAAHPRMGGENLVIKAKNAQRVGSSPHGRGKRVKAGHVREEVRLIPAWAGKTVMPGG